MGDQYDGQFFYACINQSVAAADMTMNIMNANVNVRCVESGAKKLIGLTVSSILALVSFA